MFNPITKEWEYWEQSGPIYGEASAPARWEGTIAPWLMQQGFIRGDNEPCVYYHPSRDLLILLYVDDIQYDGASWEDVEWCSGELEKRFKCKELDKLVKGNPVDHLGINGDKCG